MGKTRDLAELGFIGTDFTSDPAAPATGIKLFPKLRGGRRFLTQLSPVYKAELQPHIGFKKVQLVELVWGSTSGTFLGLSSQSVTGTTTARTPASTNYQTQARRVGFVSAATASATASVRQTQTQWWRGNAAGLGGFVFIQRFGISQTVAGYDFFAGMSPGTSISAATLPSNLTDILGVGKDTGDTNFQILCNDGSGAATKTDTGVAPATDTMYAVVISCFPNDSTVYIALVNLGSGAVIYDGSFSTNIPANTTFLSYILYISNHTSTGTVANEFGGLYVESDS